eukprot:c14215_g1_i1 orf=204-590(+)
MRQLQKILPRYSKRPLGATSCLFFVRASILCQALNSDHLVQSHELGWWLLIVRIMLVGFCNGALVNDDRNEDAEGEDEGGGAPVEAKILLQIFAMGSPVLNVLVLAHTHTPRHCLLSLLSAASKLCSS